MYVCASALLSLFYFPSCCRMDELSAKIKYIFRQVLRFVQILETNLKLYSFIVFISFYYHDLDIGKLHNHRAD